MEIENIKLKRTTSEDPSFQQLILMLDADLRHRNGLLMDVYDKHNVIKRNETVLLAYISKEAAGCGCFKAVDNTSIEIKRMFVHPDFRGRGVSWKILRELENWAKELGYQYTILETGQKQNEAISLYTKVGYSRIPNYGPYKDMPNSLCFGKQLNLFVITLKH